MLLRALSVLYCAALLREATPAQQTGQPAAALGESLRVQISGPVGLQAALAREGVIGDHVEVHQQGAWETATVVVGEAELRGLRSALPPGTLFLVLETSRPFSQIAAAGAVAAQFYSWPGYHTRAEVVTDLQGLEQSYPSLCKLYDLQSRYGAPMTHDGFRIYALRISNAPDQDQDKPNLVLSANTHANELAVIEVPLYVAEQLLQGYGSDPQLPLSLSALGAPGCALLVSGDATRLVATDAGGAAAVSITVPHVPSLLDATFFEQFAVLDPAANGFGFAFSNAGVGVIGH